jgi:hypothetical protein
VILILRIAYLPGTFKALAQGPDIYRKAKMNGLSNLHTHRLTRFWLFQWFLRSDCHLQPGNLP